LISGPIFNFFFTLNTEAIKGEQKIIENAKPGSNKYFQRGLRRLAGELRPRECELSNTRTTNNYMWKLLSQKRNIKRCMNQKEAKSNQQGSIVKFWT
jgi:hypothetical protein